MRSFKYGYLFLFSNFDFLSTVSYYQDIRLFVQKRLFKSIQSYSFESEKLLVFIFLFCFQKRPVIIFKHMHLNVINVYKYMHKNRNTVVEKPSVNPHRTPLGGHFHKIHYQQGYVPQLYTETKMLSCKVTAISSAYGQMMSEVLISPTEKESPIIPQHLEEFLNMVHNLLRFPDWTS